ncbi:caspase recruitment domain-containing protein 16 [Callospermophilus lateralis]|uniref:caspase recruitment domain-containing protein 16 n=1 Tax=Callospermophilus lateralis TaxID=76772 RepID=UPI0040540D66
MADKKLKEKRKTFIISVSEDTLYTLLDDLLSEEIVNQEEAENVKKKSATTKDKARDLIDSVIPKGSCASQKLIDYICKRDSSLAYKLGFSSGEIPRFYLKILNDLINKTIDIYSVECNVLLYWSIVGRLNQAN